MDTHKRLDFLDTDILSWKNFPINFRYEKHYYEIQAGTFRRFSFSPTTQSRKARFVITHPDYESENMQNDISIIMLDKPFLFNRWIRQVCLPSPSILGTEWNKEPSPLSMCIAIGWGALREDGPNCKINFQNPDNNFVYLLINKYANNTRTFYQLCV